jgi:outer membrane protein assembly factor BamB
MLRILINRLLLFAVLAGMILQHSVNAATPPGARSLEPLNLEVSWLGQAVLDRSRDKIRYITNDEELVYVQSTAGTVTAFNAETGRRMWVRQVGRNDAHAMQAVSNSDLVLIVAGPVAWGLDKFTGEDKFRFRLKRLPTAAPAMDDAAVYFPLGDGGIYGYALQTLTHLERYNTLPPGVAKPHLWRFVCNERVEQPPIATDSVVAFTSRSNNLHSVSPAGISYYQEFLNAPASAPMALDVHSDRENILLATEDGNLFSFDLTRGTLAWSVPLERRVSRQPLVVGRRVFVVTEASGVTCVSTESGTYVQVETGGGLPRRWHVPGIESLVGAAGDHLYGIDRNRRIVAIRRDNGEISGRTPVNGYALHHQNSATDRLYLASEFGELMCLKRNGTEFAIYHQRPDKEPLDVDVPAKYQDAEAGE